MDPSPKSILAGRILSGLFVAFLVGSALGKLSGHALIVEMLTVKLGYQASTVRVVGLIELACAIVYALPQTAVLGAVLVTGYFGGAAASHVRATDPFITPLILGAVAWAGLLLREPRLRALFPVRR